MEVRKVVINNNFTHNALESSFVGENKNFDVAKIESNINDVAKINSANNVEDKNFKITREEGKTAFLFLEKLDFAFYGLFKPLIGISKGIKELLKSEFFKESISKIAKETGKYISTASLVTNTYILFREVFKAKQDGEITKKELFELVGKGLGLYSGDVVGGIIGKLAGSTLGALIGSLIPVAGTLTGAAVGGTVGKAIGTALGSIYGKDLFKKISTKLYYSMQKI